MKRTRASLGNAAPEPGPAAARVSLRAMYADALKQVLADPRKAIAEHDPWLAALLPPAAPDSAP